MIKMFVQKKFPSLEYVSTIVVLMHLPHLQLNFPMEYAQYVGYTLNRVCQYFNQRAECIYFSYITLLDIAILLTISTDL